MNKKKLKRQQMLEKQGIEKKKVKAARKLPNIYPLTPDAHKMMKNFASMLGPFQRRDENGNLMFRTVTKLKKSTLTGNKIKNEFNKISEPMMVNHELELCNIYQKDGMRGVKIYCDFFHELRKEQLPELLEAEKAKQEAATPQPEQGAKIISLGN
jgi:hypothetical protein